MRDILKAGPHQKAVIYREEVFQDDGQIKFSGETRLIMIQHVGNVTIVSIFIVRFILTLNSEGGGVSIDRRRGRRIFMERPLQPDDTWAWLSSLLVMGDVGRTLVEFHLI